MCRDRKQISSYLRNDQEAGITKRCEETFGGDGYTPTVLTVSQMHTN